MAAERNTQHTARRMLPLLAILVSGACLRFFRLGSQGLWLDEAFSLWMARQPVGEMLRWLVRIDQHPPLYYLLLHAWIRLGEGEATLRALSGLCSTLTIPVVYLLGRRLGGRSVGLWAALILAISPFHVHMAQEARMYALLALNASLALYALARLLTDPRASTVRLGQQVVAAWHTWRDTRRLPSLRAIETDLAWLGYVVFTAATLLTHNTAVFFPIAANLLVAGLFLIRPLSPSPRVSSSPCLPSSLSPPPPLSSSPRPPLSSSPPPPISPRNWLLAQLAVLLLWCPWLPALVIQSAGVYRAFWLPTPTWSNFTGVLGTFVSEFLPPRPAALCLLSGLGVSLAALGVAHLRRRSARVAFLLVFLVVPIAGEGLVSLRRPILYDRTLIWASLPLYLLLAAGLRHLRRRGWLLAAVVTLLALNGVSLREYYVAFEKEEWDTAAAFVAGRVEPGDLILFNASWVQIPFDYYFARHDAPAVVEHGLPVDLFDRGELEPRMMPGDQDRLRALVRGHGRVWLVYSHDWYTDPEGLIPSTLEEERELVERRDLQGVQVRLYGRSD